MPSPDPILRCHTHPQSTCPVGSAATNSPRSEQQLRKLIGNAPVEFTVDEKTKIKHVIGYVSHILAQLDHMVPWGVISTKSHEPSRLWSACPCHDDDPRVVANTTTEAMITPTSDPKMIDLPDAHHGTKCFRFCTDPHHQNNFDYHCHAH